MLWLVRAGDAAHFGMDFRGGAWVVARERSCPFGCGLLGAVVGERGHAAHVGMDFGEGVAWCSGERLSVRGRVSWCFGL